MLNCAHVDRQPGAAPSRSSFARYAIYYTPQPGTALAAFGRSWFGRANDGVTLQAFSDAGLPAPGLPSLPWRQGATPACMRCSARRLRCATASRPTTIKSRLISFAARRKPVETGPLTLSRAGRYLVLRPVEATPSLDWLAAQCVAAFEDFAAPPSDTERAEHASPALSDYQRLLLESFGDPYVLSEYRFSITLTGPLDSAHLERVAQALWPVLEEICASGVTVDGLSLFGDERRPRADAR